MNKLAELLEYQTKEEELRKIRKNIMNSDEYKKYTQARKFLEKLPESLQALDTKAVHYQKEFATMQEKVRAFCDTINELEDADIFTEEDMTSSEKKYYEKNIKKNSETLKNLKQECQKLEETITTADKEFKNLGKMHKEMKVQMEEYKDKYLSLTKEYQDTTATLENELQQLEAKLATDIDFKKYKSKRAEKLFPVLCTVVGDNCAYCSMQQSLDTLNKLEQGVECESCGRMLYKK